MAFNLAQLFCVSQRFCRVCFYASDLWFNVVLRTSGLCNANLFGSEWICSTVNGSVSSVYMYLIYVVLWGLFNIDIVCGSVGFVWVGSRWFCKVCFIRIWSTVYGLMFSIFYFIFLLIFSAWFCKLCFIWLCVVLSRCSVGIVLSSSVKSVFMHLICVVLSRFIVYFKSDVAL